LLCELNISALGDSHIYYFGKWCAALSLSLLFRLATAKKTNTTASAQNKVVAFTCVTFFAGINAVAGVVAASGR